MNKMDLNMTSASDTEEKPRGLLGAIGRIIAFAAPVAG